MDLPFRLAQINPSLGDLHENLDLHLREIDAARRSGSQLLVFPELSLTGYFLKDQVADLALERDAPEIERLVGQTRDLSIVFGFVERGEGDQLYNSLAFCEDGEILDVHRKVHLVSYGMFDEARDFAPGDGYMTVESRHGRFGMLLCEDMWHIGGGYTYFMDRVDACIVSSASPGRGVSAGDVGLRSVEIWDTLLSAQAMLFQAYFLYCNRVGWEDGIGFSGHSALFGPEGRRRTRLEGFELGRLDGRMASASLRRTRIRTPLRRDERPEIVQSALISLTNERMVRRGQALQKKLQKKGQS